MVPTPDADHAAAPEPDRPEPGADTWAGPGAVLFDIDGSLVDSNFLHVHAWALAFADAGHPVDAWRIHRSIGMGSPLLLADLLGDDVDRLGDAVKDGHAERYAELGDRLRAFDGARELVRAVADRGAVTVLATSAAPEELERLQSLLDLDDVLDAITSAQDVDAAKPDPELVETALRKAGVPPDRAVFVGDAVWDVQAAARAGVPCVGLLAGGTSAAELTEAGAVAVYDDAAHLLREIDDSPLAAMWTAGSSGSVQARAQASAG
ncbi:HAD family hydrolase [Cellulomonas sp. ATA003]|uniref:HAD family hydrolase n=1 Tax=Cellulomonas sp. ATA003 TaxID=3073064 RepID=UPI002873CC29|nr:HAD family hydrolase [Cellulomonas sp. ATA003]WNB85511.1 HAD family hydrolase [Cellulomonas sp. ATA003]